MMTDSGLQCNVDTLVTKKDSIKAVPVIDSTKKN